MNTEGLFDTNTEMGAFLDDAVNGPKATEKYNIYVRTYYELRPATLIKENPKSYLIRNWFGDKYRVPKHRCAWADEEITLVEEPYRGFEGTYRIERELYPEWRLPARDIRGAMYQANIPGYIRESAYGVLDTDYNERGQYYYTK